jgi:glycosyltransferase involved in cell wall biosynthesis
MNAWKRSDPMSTPKLSICTTNYNCAHAIRQHLDSVYSQLDEDFFEYIVVDNLSKDDSVKILREYEKTHGNMKILSQKCTMGKGRQIAFESSVGEFVMVIDTDTVYSPIFKSFVDIYFKQYSEFALQAILCGVFPRDIWIQIGGRRDVNIYEDVDMWVRIWKLGKMRWYPVFMGENLKDPGTQAGHDYMSKRYNRMEKLRRFLRREYDLLRLREVLGTDLERMYKANVVDLGLGEPVETWFKNPPKLGPYQWFTVRRREFVRILRAG